MAGKLLSDELWESIEHLFPAYEPSPLGGRPAVDNRTALTVILFVLKTGISWEDSPQELGCSGKTASRRLAEWNELGVWRKVHAYLLAMLQGADQIDWSRSLLDSSFVKAPLGGENAGRIPRIAAGRAVSITC
jgi:transposase